MAQAIVIGSGGGGGSGTDRFAPKYMVGNELDGDTAAAYAASGFTYFSDSGDGSGIAAALAAAAVTPGDICVRPGTYDLGLGEVTAPLVIPASTRIYGAGHANTLIISKRTGDQGIFRANSGVVEIDSFGFSVLTEAGEFSGQTSVVLAMGDCALVVRRSSFALDITEDTVMRSCIRGQGATLDVVDCSGTGPALLGEESGDWVCFLRTDNGLTRTTLQHARTTGFDTVVLVGDSTCLVEDLNAGDWAQWAIYQEGSGTLGVETSVLAAESPVTGGIFFVGNIFSAQQSSYVTTTSITGNSTLGPAVQIASGPNGGRVRVTANGIFWARASGAAVEIGDGTPGGFCDFNIVSTNHITNGSGIGVRVLDTSCRRNNVSINTIDAVTPITNSSGTTQIIGNV